MLRPAFFPRFTTPIASIFRLVFADRSQVEADGRKTTHVVIERKGRMAMPLDIVVTYNDGDQEIFYAPLEGMRGAKPAEDRSARTVLPDHRWVDPTYEFEIPERAKKIAKVEIDPSHRMADIDFSNNVWEKK